MKVKRYLIAGPSSSGKTTLAYELGKVTGYPVFSLDSFRARCIRHVDHGGKQYRAYEHPDCWHGRAFAGMLATQSGPWIAEGTCLFQYREVLEWLDAARFFVEVPFQVCLARRLKRGRHGPSDEAFAAIGEAETLRWIEPQRKVAGVHILDGTLPSLDLAKLLIAQT